MATWCRISFGWLFVPCSSIGRRWARVQCLGQVKPTLETSDSKLKPYCTWWKFVLVLQNRYFLNNWSGFCLRYFQLKPLNDLLPCCTGTLYIPLLYSHPAVPQAAEQLRYCMPSNADTVLCIDPGEQQMKTIGGPLEGDWKWHGGNLGEELRQKQLEWVELAQLLLIAKLLHAQ